MPVETYPDVMPLTELRTPELLLVATLRIFTESAWAHGSQDWSEGLVAANVSAEGVRGLVGLFDVIAIAPRRKLAVACLHCCVLCRDEGRFLQLIASLQRSDIDDATQVLLHWVAPAAARLALPHAQALADGLAQQGYLLPRRAAMARMFPEYPSAPASGYLH